MKIFYFLFVCSLLILSSCKQNESKSDTQLNYKRLSISLEKHKITEQIAKQKLKLQLMPQSKYIQTLYKKHNKKTNPIYGYIRVNLTIEATGKIKKVVLQSNVTNEIFLKDVKKHYQKLQLKPTGLDSTIQVHFKHKFEK